MGSLTDLKCRNGVNGQELSDGNNLVLRIGTKRRTWTLVWQATHEGKARTRKARLGEYPTMGLSAARQAAQEGMVRVRAGHAPVALPEVSTPALPPPKPRGLTVYDVLRTYMLRHVKVNARDPDQVEWVIETLLKSLHGRQAGTLTRREVTAFLDDVSDTRNSPSSAYRAGSVLRAAFRFGNRRGDIDHDPTHLMALPSSGQARERVLSEAEMAALWRTDVAVWSRLFRVLALTGLRLREAAEAPVTELVGDLWTIPSARMKGGRAHVVPLYPALKAELGELDGKRWLFRSPRRFDQPVKGFSRGLEALQEAAGTPDDWTWHDIRRTVASGMQRIGAPFEVIEATLAHRRPGISSVYQRHEYVAERHHWLSQWAKMCSQRDYRLTTDS